MLPFNDMKLVLINDGTAFAGRFESEQRKKFFVERFSDDYVFYCDLNMVDNWFHGSHHAYGSQRVYIACLVCCKAMSSC